jgi:hypothetical protein
MDNASMMDDEDSMMGDGMGAARGATPICALKQPDSVASRAR